MGLLDRLTSREVMTDPRLSMIAGLLTPTPDSAFGPALGQGLLGMQQATALNSREQLKQLQAKQAQMSILGAQQQAEQRQQLAGLLQEAGGDPEKLVNTLMSNPATLQHGISLMNALKPPAGGITNIVGGEFKIPPGFKLNPLAGQPGQPDVIPIKGGPVGRDAPEPAAKKALLVNARAIVPNVRAAIMPEGKVDRGIVATMNVNAPFTEGRKVRAQILDAMEAKLRAESGAAVPQSEVERSAARFMPSSLDSDEQIEDKLMRMERFIDTALELSDPELLERLKQGEPQEVKIEKKSIGGRNFIKRDGQWFEVTP